MIKRALTLLPLLGVLLSCGSISELPQGYAIVYGVSSYASINDLEQPDDDAIAIAALLQRQGYQIISGGPRLNADATRANLDADFAALAASASSESRFFFYFAGHGYGDGMEHLYGSPPFSQEWADHLAQTSGSEPRGSGPANEYLFLHDANPFTDVPLTVEESISDDYLAELLASVPSRQRVVVIDACHSGGFIGSGTAVDTTPGSFEGPDEGISLLDALNAVTLYLEHGSAGAQDVDERSAIVISAAGEQEFSYEGDWLGLPNGIFTHFFLESTRQADHNFDGYITATEAYAYAAGAVASVANERLSGQGKFMPRVSGGAVDYVLFRAE